MKSNGYSIHSFCSHTFTPYLFNSNYPFGGICSAQRIVLGASKKNHHHFEDNDTEVQGPVLFLVTSGDSNFGRHWILHSEVAAPSLRFCKEDPKLGH